MALISCEECSHIVSDQALDCPQCGYPICHDLTAEARANRLVTIQKTGKPLKGAILVSAAAMAWGFIGYASNHSPNDLDRTAGLWAMLFVLGGLSFVSLQFVKWWNHG